MKGLIKFLLNTGVGREIVKAIIGAVIQWIRRKLKELEEKKKGATLPELLKLVHEEMHAEVDSGKVKPTDLL